MAQRRDQLTTWGDFKKRLIAFGCQYDGRQVLLAGGKVRTRHFFSRYIGGGRNMPADCPELQDHEPLALRIAWRILNTLNMRPEDIGLILPPLP